MGLDERTDDVLLTGICDCHQPTVRAFPEPAPATTGSALAAVRPPDNPSGHASDHPPTGTRDGILAGMDLDEWWNGVMPQTRDWLIAHNGEALTPEVVADISRAGGLIASDSWWMGERGADGVFLSDAATDWVASRADGE